ncbi:MAG: hypothetical protein IT235_06210 [Bacteroidia bacterium]|nr:hypothetical protein [Bacteroidia bacterium]
MKPKSPRQARAQKKFVALARQLKTPKRVQQFIKAMPYNKEEGGETVHSAYEALRYNKAHCLEGTFIAAAILEQLGYPTTVVSIESKDKLGHALFLFRSKGKWGAISHSKDEGLHGRAPVFRSVRDLVWSYYDPYIDNTGKITEYGVANLDDTRCDWRASIRNVRKAEKYLAGLKHTPLRSSKKRYKKALAQFKKFGRPKPENYWW